MRSKKKQYYSNTDLEVALKPPLPKRRVSASFGSIFCCCFYTLSCHFNLNIKKKDYFEFAGTLPKRNGLGEFGAAVIITNPSIEEKVQIDQGWDRQGFNEFVCNKISLSRQLGDKRERACRDVKFRKPLPDNSVIIVFHNEAWCTLLRTVYPRGIYLQDIIEKLHGRPIRTTFWPKI